MAENEPKTADEPRNPHVHYESGDVNAVSVTKLGIGMAFLVLVFLFGLLGLFRYFAKRADEAQSAEPMGAMRRKLPPQPRLEAHPALDMTEMRASEDRQMHQYAWIDQAKGIVQIPVDRAMELILEPGVLPVRPQPGVPVSATAGKIP